MLLLSEYDIYKADQAWDNTDPLSHSWATDSRINKMLNNGTSEGGTLFDCFSEKERAKIMETIKVESDSINWYDTTHYAYGCGLTGEKLFLLSAKEAVNKEYGFANIEDKVNLAYDKGGLPDSNKIAKRGDAAGGGIAWWLRSAFSKSANRVAYVYWNGSAFRSHPDFKIGVRFALNIPLSSIVYTSDASEGNSASSFAPISNKAQIPAICAQSTAPSEATILAGASKLTILDDSRSSFQVTEDNATAKAGGQVTLNYTGAQTTSNEYISIIIKNSEGEGLYYGTPKAVTTADDTVTFNVPEYLPAGTYTLEVLNEQKNLAKETNYAGLDTVSLSVSVVPPRKAVLTAIEEADGAGLWKVVRTPSADARALATFTGEGKTQTVVFDVPYYEPAITEVYVVDYAENVSDPIPLTSDSSSPTKEVTYNEGTITVTITDEGAGIKSVDEAEKEPTPTGYPTEVTVPVTDKNKSSVNVVDALGNDATVDIDRSAPTITKAYKRIDEANNVKKAIITASDEGDARLWKIIGTNNAYATAVYDGYTGTGDDLPKVFDIEGTVPTEVYAVDHAGNISAEAKALADDNEPPVGKVVYNKGTITLKVTDNQSGIVKIGDTPYTDYPASKDYNVTIGTPSVDMVDALGNTSTITIDTTAPEATRAFIRVADGQGNVIITATDTESGMWKVVDESDNVLYECNEGDSETVRFTTTNTTLAKVCLVDHAGNKSAAIELTVDNTAPTVTRAFKKVNGEQGKIIIKATDAGSGMWKVVDESDNVLYTYKEGDPETVRFTTENTTLAKVCLVDNAGNKSDAVELKGDTTKPSAVRGYIEQAQA